MRVYTFLLLLISVLLISCSPKINNSTLIFNESCQYPCWNGIKPGKTTKQELLDLLMDQNAASMAVDTSSIHTVKYLASGFEEFVDFNLSDTDIYVRAYISDGIVQLVSFEDGLHLTVSQVIEHTQVPEKIYLLDNHDGYYVHLLIPSKGVWFAFPIDSLEASIEPDTPIDYLSFFDPEQYGLLFDTNVFAFDTLQSDTLKEEMRDWNGFGKINQVYFP